MSTNEDRQTQLEKSAKSALNFMTKYKTKSEPKTLTEALEKPSDINDLVTSIIDETGDDVELNEDAKVEDETPVVADSVVEPIVEDDSEPVVEDVVTEPVVEPVVTDPVVAEPVVEDSDEPVTEVTEVTDVTDVVSEDIAFNDHELEVFNMLMQEIKESDEVDEDDPIVQEDAVDEPDLDLDLDLEESFNNILDDEDEDVDDSEDFDLDLDLNF